MNWFIIRDIILGRKQRLTFRNILRYFTIELEDTPVLAIFHLLHMLD